MQVARPTTTVTKQGVGAGATMSLGMAGVVLFALYQAGSTHYRAIELAKYQDRHFFLAFVREAQNILELNAAGFFEYETENYGPAWIATTKALTARFKEALDVEPQWEDW